jgi:starch-binding outer membrane protein, SusD/RagB family
MKRLLLSIFTLIALTGCRKYLEPPLPINTLAASSAFSNDATAGGVLSGVFGELFSQGDFDGNSSVGTVTGLYGDELQNYLTIIPDYQEVYADAVNSAEFLVTTKWSNFYGQLYSVNLAIEGLTPATGLNYRNQWLGEAYFLRGLLFFYLTNLYGDVPLALSSNYLTNNTLARSPQADVYKQIVADLLQAQILLDSKYHDANGQVTTDRGRPDHAAATALLARIYLYTGDWKDAEAQAGSLIADGGDYQLVKLAQTFLINSTEIIWGLEPFQGASYPAYVVKDTRAYILPKGVSPLAAFIFSSLSDSLVNAFEPGDARFTNWVGADTVAASGSTPMTVYYYAYKYKANVGYTAPQESLVMFRLAEQYLIRAEARAQQNNLTGALADLDAIRARAGLPASTALSQADVLAAIQRERRVELFVEDGHRFLDLRRTGNLDALMSTVCPQKGGAWASFKEWWPIPLTDIQNDTHLTQTPGYE